MVRFAVGDFFVLFCLEYSAGRSSRSILPRRAGGTKEARLFQFHFILCIFVPDWKVSDFSPVLVLVSKAHLSSAPTASNACRPIKGDRRLSTKRRGYYVLVSLIRTYVNEIRSSSICYSLFFNVPIPLFHYDNDDLSL
jgi:hypothetical protein